MVPATLDLSADEFLHEAIMASGCKAEDVSGYEEKLRAVGFEYLKKSANYSSKKETAEKALTFLYEKILKQYSANQSLITAAIVNGKYNCVSSSVVYMYMMKVCEIECWGNETPLHAFCTVVIDGKKIDVETTNPYGFDPGTKKQVSDTRYYTVPATNYRKRVEIGDRRLLALVYNNRINLLQKQHKPEEMFTLALAADDLQLHSERSSQFLYAVAANVMVEYMSMKKDAEALSFAREFLKDHETDKNITQNIAAACSNIVRNYEIRKNYDGAFKFLEENKDILSDEHYSNFKYMLIHNSLNTFLKTADFENGLKKIEESKEDLKPKDYTEFIQVCYSQEINRLTKAKKFYSALVLAKDANEKFPNDKVLADNLRMAKQNYAALVHNTVLPLINTGKTSEAREILEKGLKELGPTKLLENDLKRLQ